MNDFIFMSPSLEGVVALDGDELIISVKSNEMTVAGVFLTYEASASSLRVSFMIDFHDIQDALGIGDITHVDITTSEISMLSRDIPSDWKQKKEIRRNETREIVFVLSVTRDDM